MKIISMPSPNFDTRGGVGVDMLVLHYTGMTSADEALSRLCDGQAKVSSHYTIDEDGTVYAHVPEEVRAWHAGLSFWAGTRNVNACSIGIELVNPGHEFGYRAFPDAQIAALTELAQGIIARHAILPARVLGHSDVAPARKEDPGELFPWKALAQNGVGLWPKPVATTATAADLIRFGYDPEVAQEKAILAFQRHYRPTHLSGVWDSECAFLLAGLL